MSITPETQQNIADLMKKRDALLADLKIIETDILKYCDSIADARVIIGESKIGRPKGSCNKKSLDTIILETICNSADGASVHEITASIAKEGYVSTSSPSDFINIIRSRLSVLKKHKKIIRCEIDNKYKISN